MVVIGEFDGKVKYGRLLRPDQRIEDVIQAERERERALQNLGHWVVRWVWRSLEAPAEFAKPLTPGPGPRPALTRGSGMDLRLGHRTPCPDRTPMPRRSVGSAVVWLADLHGDHTRS